MLDLPYQNICWKLAPILRIFLKEKRTKSLLLKGTDEKETKKVNLQLSNKKAPGPISISASSLKENVNILSGLLSHVINLTPMFALLIEQFCYHQ